MDDVAAYMETTLSSWGLGVVKSKKRSSDLPIYGPFQLPIQHLNDSVLHGLTPTIGSDLELIHAPGEGKGMYDYLFQPSHEFGQQMIQEWAKQYGIV